MYCPQTYCFTDTFLHIAINFSDTKTAPILCEDLFFGGGLHLISGPKPIPILCEDFFPPYLIHKCKSFPKQRTHTKIYAHTDYKKLEGTLTASTGIIKKCACNLYAKFKPISVRVDRASASEKLESASIPGRIKTKDYKNWYLQLPCFTFSIEGQCEASTVYGRQVVTLLEDRLKALSLSLGQGNLVNKM